MDDVCSRCGADLATGAYLAWLAPAIDRAEAARSAAQGDLPAARAALERALDAYRRLGMAAQVATTVERLERVADRTA